MNISFSEIIDDASFALAIVIAILAIAYCYFEIRNTYRKVIRERFFERVRQKMSEEAPSIRQRLVANFAEYPKISYEEGVVGDELKSKSDQFKQERIVHSQMMSDLDRLYIYSSIDEHVLYEFSTILKERIAAMRIDIGERQHLVQILEGWYMGYMGREREYLRQFYVGRNIGPEKRMLNLLTRKLIEERGEKFILKQRARIFESVRRIIQMTS